MISSERQNMAPELKSLYARIRAYSFDEPETVYPFARRLAHENGWTLGYAVRAIAEYRKFTFLSLAAGHPVSPSDQVDQVWHLHILNTQVYWNQFCTDVLRKPLHHGPSKGGAAERTKFNDWYQRTLDSYTRFFGCPPEDLWPAPAVRFGRDLQFCRVNTERCWVIRRPCLRGGRLAVAGFVLTFAAVLIWMF